MEVEAAYRTLQYKHDQESEARRVSEALHNQLKEQITRAEDKLAKYVYTNTMGVGWCWETFVGSLSWRDVGIVGCVL